MALGTPGSARDAVVTAGLLPNLYKSDLGSGALLRLLEQRLSEGARCPNSTRYLCPIAPKAQPLGCRQPARAWPKLRSRSAMPSRRWKVEPSIFWSISAYQRARAAGSLEPYFAENDRMTGVAGAGGRPRLSTASTHHATRAARENRHALRARAEQTGLALVAVRHRCSHNGI